MTEITKRFSVGDKVQIDEKYFDDDVAYSYWMKGKTFLVVAVRDVDGKGYKPFGGSDQIVTIDTGDDPDHPSQSYHGYWLNKVDN